MFVSSSGPNLLPKKNTEMFMFSESLKPASRLKSLKLSVVGSRLMMLLISLVSVQWNKLPTWPESFHICICILEHFSVLSLLTLCLRVCWGGVHAWVRCGFWVNVFKCIYLNAKHVKMTWDKTCCITKLTCCLNSGSWTSDVNSQPNLADVPLHQQECLTNMFFFNLILFNQSQNLI